jgi:hypothetical protein
LAKDALLSVTGPADAPGNPVEAAAITADADGTKGYVYVGKYRNGYIEGRIAGAFDRTTGDETLAFEVHEATDAAGTGATLIASGSALTATHAANLDENAASGKAAGTLSDGPVRIGFQTGAGGFIKVRFNVSGTTPSAANVSADIVMLSDAFRQSGT